jgi:hypothetical protein
MAEVDRRGFFKILRRTDPSSESRRPEAEPTAQDPRVKDLSDLTLRLLADVEAEGEERLAEGTVMTAPYDLVYMRITAGHIVFSAETGFSAIIPTKDVTVFEAEPPAESTGYGNLVHAVIRFRHPADPEHITRSHAFRFREDSPLMAAIRDACDLPEPAPDDDRAEPTAGGGDPTPTAGETLT